MNWQLLKPYLLLAPTIILLRLFLEATETAGWLTPWLSILFLVVFLTFHLPLRVEAGASHPFLRIYANILCFLIWCQFWICIALALESFLDLGTHHRIAPPIRNAEAYPGDVIPIESLGVHIVWHLLLEGLLLSLVTGALAGLVFHFRTQGNAQGTAAT